MDGVKWIKYVVTKINLTIGSEHTMHYMTYYFVVHLELIGFC